MDELITVRQLPVIEERLRQIRGEIEEKVSTALAMECTEQTVKEVKVVRAALTKDFQELEERRKQVKNKILSPYEAFEAVYKECVTDVYRPADGKLAEKIHEVEDGLKSQKQAELAAYFDEYRQSKGIGFVTLEQAGISVTLSVSGKKLKEQARAFLDRVSDELELIGAQEHAEEILVEYKRDLNAAHAIMTVKQRHEAVEREKERARQAAQARAEREQAAQKVEAALSAPISEPVAAPVPEEIPPEEAAPKQEGSAAAGKQYFVSFTVRGTLAQLKALKAFLTEGGYTYEQH